MIVATRDALVAVALADRVVETHARKYHVALLGHDAFGIITCDNWRRVAVSSESVVYSDMAKLRTLRRLLKQRWIFCSKKKLMQFMLLERPLK